MRPKFVKCELCKIEVPSEKCEFATFKIIVDGKEQFFCCSKCYEKNQKKEKIK